MLQIRLSKVQAPEGLAGVKPSPVETITVTCPDHLVLADLPVAKGIGSATATSLVKTLGRRSRRQCGDCVHFCVCCDFPIAIYGRLSPCEHAFCLDCARSDSICYLCDERIQKIQTIKMLEGIFICAAPHCFKSFLKKSEFEMHIQDVHADLLRHNVDKEDGNESETHNSVWQSAMSDSSAHASQRPVFSPGSNSQLHDREDKAGQQPLRDQPPSRPALQPKPPFGQVQNHSADLQPGSNGGIPPGFYQQNSDMQRPPQEPSQFTDHHRGVTPETPLPDYPSMHSSQTPSFAVPVNAKPMLNPPVPFGYPPYPPHEGAPPFYPNLYDMRRQDSASEVGGDQSSLLGFLPGATAGPNFPVNYTQPLNAGTGGLPFEQGHGGMAMDPRDAKGILAPQSMPLPPPPPLPLLPMSHLNQKYYSSEFGHNGHGYGWQHDNPEAFGGQD